MNEDRIITPERHESDGSEGSMRPLELSEFVGQAKVRENLRVFIDAARGRAEAMDHTLFFGPRVWARRRWRRSWRGSWASVSGQHPGR